MSKPVTGSFHHSTDATPADQERHALSLHIRDKYHQLDINLIISHAFLANLRAATAVHPLHEEYSLQEDRLLLYVDISTKLQEDENGQEKKATAKDFVQAYQSRAKNQKPGSNSFNKTGFSGTQFKERLSSLRSQDGLRYTILLNSVNAEVDEIKKQQQILEMKAMTAEIEEDKKPGIQEVHAQEMDKRRNFIMSSALSNQYIGSRIRRNTVAAGGKPFHHSHPIVGEDNETIVEVVLSGRKFEQKTICTLERRLAHCSPYLKRLLETTPPQESKILGEPIKQIDFSEYDQQYRNFDMYDCFNPLNFNRFIMFIENPEVQDKYRESQERLRVFHEQNEKMLNDTIQLLLNRKAERVKFYEEGFMKQRTELLRVLKKCKECDMERLHTLYEVHIQNETEKIDKMLSIHKAELEEFFDREVNEIREIFKEQQTQQLSKLQAEIQDTQAMIDKMFPREDQHLISMLILSDILKVEDLRMCCIKFITEDSERFERVFKSQESLSSPFLRTDTIELMMSHLLTTTLLNLSNKYDYHFDRSYVLKELKYRESMLADEYRNMKIEDLIEIQESGTSLFPHVLEKEIERRKNKKLFVYIDPMQTSPFLEVLDDQLTVSLKGLNRYSSLCATQPRQFNGWGKWFFEVEILSFPQIVTGASISIGWDAFRGNSSANYDGAIPGLTVGERNQYGYSWQSDGVFHYEGKGEFCESQFGEGDVIGCAINQDKKLITFYKNGTKIILMRRETTKKGTQTKKVVQEIHSIQIVDKNYKLYPSACLFSPKKNVEITIKFNFSGPFRYAVPTLHEPYGFTNLRK